MDRKTSQLLVLYICLVAFCTSPIWLSGYFINQDGAAHVNNAGVMLGLLQGNEHYNELYSFNSFALPNSIGHWFLAALLLFTSPFAATKVMVIGIFAATVAAAAYLRFQTEGLNGISTSMFIGAAVSFNWLWLVGLYNFCLGACIVILTIAVFSKWRDSMTVQRTLGLILLLFLAYASHLIAAASLVGSLFILAVFSRAEVRKVTLSRTILAATTLLPLALIYSSLSVSSDVSFIPTWRSVTYPASLTSWFNQILAADPFIIISRKTFPFSESFSPWFTIFTPGLWIASAFVLISIATILNRRKDDKNSAVQPEYLMIFAIFLIAALFGPDDFGSVHGGVLRQRILIIGLLLFIPIFQLSSKTLKAATNSILLFVIAFQTYALWDYAHYSDAVGREFVTAQSAVPDSGGIASLVVLDKTLRYHASPVSMINNFNGIGRKNIVWDNYELGHYLFPVILNSPEDKEFVYRLTQNSALEIDVFEPRFPEQMTQIDELFRSDNGRINTLLVWGTLIELDAVVTKYFENDPFYRSQNVRLYRRKQIVNDVIDGN